MPQTARSLAILFADISGSTRLYETLGDAQARQRVAECLALLTAEVHRHQGTVVKTIGDEVMSTFPTATAAVQAACAMQEAVTAQAAHGQASLAIRVGLHYGPVLVEEGDVFGDAVNVAARMVGLAKANQIITTAQTVAALPAALRSATRCIDRAPVKGKQEELDIYEVIWREDDLTRMEASPVSPPPSVQARLWLRVGDREVELHAARPSVTLGRGQQNDLVIQDEYTSRLHARIEYRRHKFVLLDQSTNGTFVRTADGKVTTLRREEMTLQGTGVISLGRAFSEETPHLIHFRCEP
ncbi:MAG: FHA domain-containing protein [Candidatus Binatia bacterium]|nr:FHA domain-containing protein [Candidatus Binatia bacterium]